MKAWRIVQATVYAHLYEAPHGPHRLRKTERQRQSRWYEPESLLDNGASYYPGSYFRVMLQILYFLIVLAHVPLFAMLFQIYARRPENPWWRVHFGAGLAILVVSLVYCTWFVIVKDLERARNLSNGLLSIHSCAIMWTAVAVAHYRALADSRALSEGESLKGYTQFLSQHANRLCVEMAAAADGTPYRWISGEYRKRLIPRIVLDREIQAQLSVGDHSQRGFVANYSIDGSGLLFRPAQPTGASAGMPAKVEIEPGPVVLEVSVLRVDSTVGLCVKSTDKETLLKAMPSL